jgi:branched-chain amino acid transport system ATP-binding protein
MEILHGIGLEVRPGECVAILGPNGAGKTTLMRALGGLLPARQGAIVLDGVDITKSPASRRAASGLCLIPEGRAIYRSLTVAENLAMHCGGRDLNGAIDTATTYFPILGSRLKQVAGTLSGGQQQMLALSRAVVRKAPLVMADELSLGLAPIVVDEIFAALQRLVHEGSSLLVVEQYVAKVMGVADRLYMLNRGRCVFEGTPDQAKKADVYARYLGDVALTDAADG